MITNKKQQQGVTLIEVLIAVVIFALGMLGQVAFMLTAMQNSQQSRYRAIASYYAEEMLGMALADTANRTKYAVSGSACTTANWAPCTQWLSRLQTDLPQVAGTPTSVTFTSSTGAMAISISWKGMNDTQTYSSNSNLNFIE